MVRQVKGFLIGVALLSTLFQLPLFACSSKEIWAERSAHRAVAGKILKTTRVSSKGDKSTFSVEVKVSEVLRGQPMKDEVIEVEMELWKPKKDPSYDKGKSYVIYLRKGDQDGSPANAVTRWSVKYGARSIQPDTAKLRKMLGPDEGGKDRDYRASREDVDVEKLSPLEKRMHAIVIPEIDFACANVRDVLDFLHEVSIQYDKSSIPKQEKGINLCLNGRSFAGEGSLPLVNFYMEQMSVLQVLTLASALSGGEFGTVGDWTVISKAGSGALKPNLSLGAQGTNSVLYRKLQSAVIPEVEFRQATIWDVARFLTKASNVKISVATIFEKAEEGSLITLAGKHASLLGLLEVLSVLYPLEIVLEEESVVIRQPPLLQEK